MNMPDDLISSILRSKMAAARSSPQANNESADDPSKARSAAASRTSDSAPGKMRAPDDDGGKRTEIKAEISDGTLRIRSSERTTYSVPPEAAARASLDRSPVQAARTESERTERGRESRRSDAREPADKAAERDRENLGVERSAIERKIAELKLKLAFDARKSKDSAIADFEAKQKVRERKALEREMAALDKQISGMERRQISGSRGSAYSVAQSNVEAQSSVPAKPGNVSSASMRINTVI